MNAPPRKREAVADAGHTRTADAEGSTAIVDEGEELRKFAKLQVRAARAGHSLLQVASGYLLVRGCSTRHSSSLDEILHMLAHREEAHA